MSEMEELSVYLARRRDLAESAGAVFEKDREESTSDACWNGRLHLVQQHILCFEKAEVESMSDARCEIECYPRRGLMSSPRDSGTPEVKESSFNHCDEIVGARTESVSKADASDAEFDQTTIQVDCERTCEADGTSTGMVGDLTHDHDCNATVDAEPLACKTLAEGNLRNLLSVPTPCRERNRSRTEKPQANCCKSAKATISAMPSVICAVTTTLRTAVYAGADFLLDKRRQALGQESLEAHLMHNAP
eukprot:TRINITY_DN17524_c0_g1_i1.p1 TRINITY_DN17524_c0_g1~~TRINITY_DN17524_c0_g1_i1.p1  ORF type:complete len:248 (+),score=31.35 TRINITY_DN17524_c0_g1_i1:40-783(+)